MNPGLVRRTDPETLTCALLMGASVEEVKGWDERDKRWLVAVHKAEAQKVD